MQIPPGQLDMRPISGVGNLVVNLLLFISNQVVHSTTEALMQSTKELFPVREQMLRYLTVRLWHLDQLVLSNVPIGVLVIEDKVPPLAKVNPEAVDNRTGKGDADVTPAHSAALGPVELVVLPLVDILKVVNSGVVVVLAREDNIVEVAGMGICDWVRVGVVSAKAHIEAAHKCHLSVDKAQLFMMSPVEHHIVLHPVQGLYGILGGLGKVERVEGQVPKGLKGSLCIVSVGMMIGVSEHLDVWVESLQGVLGVLHRSVRIWYEQALEQLRYIQRISLQ